MRFTKIKYFKIIAAVVVIALLVSGFAYYRNRTKAVSGNAAEQRFEKVVRGDMTITLSGSGPLVSSNRTEVASKVAGTLLKANFKLGDTVKAGDILFEIDDSNARLNIEKLENSLAQKQLTQNNNIKDGNSLRLAAPFDGYVTNIQIKNGDLASKNAAVMTLTDQSRLKMMVPFSGAAVKDMSLGMKVLVNIQDIMQTVEGTVTYISNKPYSSSTGGELFNVEVYIDNPGSIKEGMKAGVQLTGSSSTMSTQNGSLAYVTSTVLRSGTGGTVLNVHVKDNQFVYQGELLAEFQNDEILLTIETNEVSIKDLKSQLDNAKNELQYYKITSPIDGVIVKQDVGTGDSIKNAQVVAIVSNTKQMEFNIAVDELDIAKVKVGQKVNVIVDALAETAVAPLGGEVYKIAIEGTSNSGVTTYPVTVKLTGNDKLRSGMNSNGVVFIENRKNVLMVPIEAITRVGGRSYVRVRADGASATGLTAPSPSSGSRPWSQGSNAYNSSNMPSGSRIAPGNARENTSRSIPGGANASGTQSNNTRSSANNSSGALAGLLGRNGNSADYYANTVLKVVEIGITNDSSVEIINGLSEGEEVLLPSITGSSSSTRIPGASGMAIPGGFGASGARGQIQQPNR